MSAVAIVAVRSAGGLFQFEFCCSKVFQKEHKTDFLYNILIFNNLTSIYS